MRSYNTSKHVGSIDVLKFLLAIVIVLLHAGQQFGGEEYHLAMGGIAVEAFFVISGCLMCMSAKKAETRSDGSPEALGTETVQFLWKKIRELLVPYLIILIIYLICWYHTTGSNIAADEGVDVMLRGLFSLIPNMAFLSMSGILMDETLLMITWYISAMLLSMLIIYPLLRHYGKNYTLIAAPAVSLLLMGFMYHTSGDLYKGVTRFLVFMPQGLMRAFIAINLGCIAYELSLKLRKACLTLLSRTLLTVSVILLCLITFLIMEYGTEHECYTLTLLYPILIGILFSGKITGNELLNNRLSTYLGKASLYRYFYHIAIRKVLIISGLNVSYAQASVIMLLGAFIMFILTDFLQHTTKSLLQKYHIRLSALFIRSDADQSASV